MKAGKLAIWPWLIYQYNKNTLVDLPSSMPKEPIKKFQKFLDWIKNFQMRKNFINFVVLPQITFDTVKGQGTGVSPHHKLMTMYTHLSIPLCLPLCIASKKSGGNSISLFSPHLFAGEN
jgi:hypothetical protein